MSELKFAYVYLVYYLDERASNIEIFHDMHPVPCTSFERACLIATTHGVPLGRLREINKGSLWRLGNYWIHREALIDSDNHGLEFVISGMRSDVPHIRGIIPLDEAIEQYRPRTPHDESEAQS